MGQALRRAISTRMVPLFIHTDLTLDMKSAPPVPAGSVLEVRLRHLGWDQKHRLLRQMTNEGRTNISGDSHTWRLHGGDSLPSHIPLDPLAVFLVCSSLADLNAVPGK